MNTIKANIGGTPAAILSRFQAFGSKHAAQATTLELTKDGQPYVGVGRSEWEWTVDRNGARVNDKGSNFRLKAPELHGHDVALFTPCDPQRGFPDEAIESPTAVKVGDKVVIHYRKAGTKITVTVTAKDDQSFLLTVDKASPDQESGSMVTTESDQFVGFLSTKTGVSVPNMPSMPPGTTQPPRPPQPPTTPAPEPVLPTGTTPVQAFVMGVREGRQKLLAEIKAIAG